MQAFWRLLGYLKPYLGRMVLASVLLAISGAMMAAVVSTIKPLVNQVLIPGAAQAVPAAAESSAVGPDILAQVQAFLPLDRIQAWTKEHAFVQVPLLIVAIFFIRSAFLYVGQYLTIRAGHFVMRDLRAELYESVAFQSLDFYQEHPTGLILSRIMNDVGRLQRVSTVVLADLVRVGAMVPFVALTAFYHEWRMSALALVALPLLGYPMVRLGKRLRRASTRSQENMAEVASRLTESIGGVKVVQGFSMENYELRRFRDALNRMLRADLKAGRAQALAPAVMELVGAAVGAALFAFAGLYISRGSLDPGNFAVVLFCLGLLFMSFRRLNALYSDIQNALAAGVRVFEMLDRERSILDLPDARPLPAFSSGIRFEDVIFSYGDETVIDGVRLTIDRGETVAIVGPSGSGKSTLANLVPRFYDPTAGKILLDGHDIRHVTLESLRGQIGLVTQETVLFDDTVRNNIAYGRSDVSDEAVDDVARASQSYDFIRDLPDGYDTMLGERGARLSMGQRQRITIARALLKDPPILILDEATSALDAESEALVQQALDTLMKGRTSIVIAHRLATVRNADRILVLDAGRIVEEGTHDQLLRRGGAYAKFCELQFKDLRGMSRSPSGPAELRRDLLWTVLLAAIFFGAALGARDLWHPNEPVYGRAVVEMAEGGDWLLPTVNGVVFDEKPILYFWMARVAGLLLGGLDEFALRVPLALTGAASVGLVYLLVLPYAGRPRARIAAATFATTYIVFWASRAVQMDLMVLASCLLTVLLLTRAFDHGFPERRAWILAGLSAGAGFAAKGPVALVCPGLIVLGYLLATRRAHLLRTGSVAWAGLAFLVLAAPWYLALWAAGEGEFLHEVLIRQNFQRYLDPWDHQAGWGYYLVYFWIDMAPWALFVPLAAGLPDRDRDERRLDRLAWIWILVLVGFFSISASKRSAYLLPAAPAVAILVSGLAERWFAGGLGRLRRVGVVALLAGFAMALIGAAALLQLRALPEYPLVHRAGQAAALLLLAGGIAVLVALGSERSRRAAPVALFALCVSFYLLAAVWVLPAADIYKSSRYFCEEVSRRVGPDDPLRLYRPWKWRASYSYYLGRSIESLGSTDDLKRFAEGSEEGYVIVEGAWGAEARAALGDREPLVTRRVGSRTVRLFSTHDVAGPRDQSGGS